MKDSQVFDCTLVKLAKNHSDRGNITAVTQEKQVPFSIERVYYLYDVPGGEARGGHAHRNLQQLVVAASGSFDLIIDDGCVRRTFHLSRPYVGVYLPSGIWREIDNFSSGSICLVLASLPYDERDYIRDYNEFVQWKL
ncbi:FdtA/QdtA family cupin domain-containing protein [Cyclobacterium xiamenense]|uniref:sugar 3,4-ketoisomerase n=1 Tax=Cyclobacterium xiamenense TaxID=1297121 RepID=UPI0035CF1E15